MIILNIIALLQCSTIYAYGNNQISCDKTFTVTGGTRLHIYNCNACSGDTRLFLYDASNIQVAYNDDNCGLCSSISYTIPSSTPMQTYTVKMDCYSSYSSCSGNIQINIASGYIYIYIFYILIYNDVVCI